MGHIRNDYVDTLRLARKVFPNLKNHKLQTLIREFGIPVSSSHRAEEDARNTAKCYEHIYQYIADNKMWDLITTGNGYKRSVRAIDISGDPAQVREDSPLYGKTVVFTGVLERMSRKEAMQIVADYGGINGDTVTKKTNFLVLGNNEINATIKDGKSSKQKKAERYILDGADLAIISENVFYDMLEEKTEPMEQTASSAEDRCEDVAIIRSDGLEFTDLERNMVAQLSKILEGNPHFEKLHFEQRSRNYISLVLGYNDFLRFQYTKRTKWISLRLPLDIANSHVDDPIFSAQKNKKQYHWKAEISSVEDLDKLGVFIIASCVCNDEEDMIMTSYPNLSSDVLLEAPNERWIYDKLYPSLVEVVHQNNLDVNKLIFKENDKYSSVWYGSQLAFRICWRGKSHYFAVSDSYAKNADDQVKKRITKIGRTDGFTNFEFDLNCDGIAEFEDFLSQVLDCAIDALPKEFDCCSRYMACSDAKQCLQPNPDLAIACGYRKVMKSGRIFCGMYRNI